MISPWVAFRFRAARYALSAAGFATFRGYSTQNSMNCASVRAASSGTSAPNMSVSRGSLSIRAISATICASEQPRIVAM